MADFIGETTDLLRRTPEVLRSLLIGLPEGWTDTPDTPDGWRPRDVVGHLITGEQSDWLERTQRILQHGTSLTFDRFDRFAMIERDPNEVLDLYFRQCSVNVTCRDLAIMAATLANDGKNPLTGEAVFDIQYVRDMLSVMNSCGMYDYAGEWAYEVGMPAKSGVSGCIIAVIPGQIGICVYSPPIDKQAEIGLEFVGLVADLPGDKAGQFKLGGDDILLFPSRSFSTRDAGYYCVHLNS